MYCGNMHNWVWSVCRSVLYPILHRECSQLTGHEKTCSVRFEVFMAVTMKNVIFWDVTLCGSCKNQSFEKKYRLHSQGDQTLRARYSPAKLWFLQEPRNITSQNTTFFTYAVIHRSKLFTSYDRSFEPVSLLAHRFIVCSLAWLCANKML
jgi:hypothetical protein